MSAVENLIVMGLEVSIDAADVEPVDAVQAELQERDRALLALVQRFGLEGVLEGVQFAAEMAADAHDTPDRPAVVGALRSVARSLANAVKLSQSVPS